MPLQHHLLNKTSTLYFTKKYLERKYIEIAQEIESPLKLYMNNTSLIMIALFAQHSSCTNRTIEIEKFLPVLGCMHKSEISEEAIIQCKNFLKFFYLDQSSEKKQASNEMLKILSVHINQSLSDDKFSNRFIDFWEQYIYMNAKSISLLYLFEYLLNNLKLLKSNKLKFLINGFEKNINDMNFEEFSWNELDQLFNEILKSRDLPNQQDNWQYAENLCNIHLATELIKLNF